MTDATADAAPSATPLKLIRLAPLVGLLALAGAAARYFVQGTGNVYTNTSQSFWLERDAVVGLVKLDGTHVWLGLEVLGAMLVAVIGTVSMFFLFRLAARAAAEGRRPAWLAKLCFVGAAVGALVCVASLAVPIVAFASGLPPEGARTDFVSRAPAAVADEAGDAAPATLAVPAGRWEVAANELNLLVAKIEAGGEAFEGSFAPVTGHIVLTPAALAGTSARFEAPSASIDTGIPLRSSHARDDLKVEANPTIALTVAALREVSAIEGGGVQFVADGEVTIIGRTLTRPITGTVKPLDAAARAQYGVPGEAALLVNADLTIPLRDVPLDRDSFDQEEIPVNARVVLVPGASPAPQE